jgi:hypothetical protein
MRRKWFRNGLGRKNSQANRQGQVWKTRSSPRSFSRTLERLEDRRLLAAITFSAGILTLNGDQDFAGENDNFALARDTSDPSKLNVTVNSDSAEYALSSITQINVFGFAGNDSLIVNSTNGLIKVQNGIQYDGGTGFDGLLLLGASTNTSDELDVGATPGAGRSLLENGPDFQEIYFQNLEPIIDQVLSSSFMIDAFGTASILNASNAINCTIASEGSITIDNFEPITSTLTRSITASVAPSARARWTSMPTPPSFSTPWNRWSSTGREATMRCDILRPAMTARAAS